MPPSKKEPAPGPDWVQDGETLWQLADLEMLRESLEATETALQSIAALDYADVVLRINENVVACHHDGLKWWVKFGG